MTSPTGSFPRYWRMATLNVRDIPDDQADPPIAQTSNEQLAQTPNLICLRRPKFQRSIVWNVNKARSFRDSLAKGYPFGVVILADGGVRESPEGLNFRLYQILDGQQRLYWLRRMRDEFFTQGWCVAAAELEVVLLDQVRSVMRAAHPGAYAEPVKAKEAQEHLLKWARVIRPDISLRDFVNAIVADLGSPAQLDERAADQRDEEARMLLAHLQERFSKFLELPIPALIVGQDLEDLSADVFYQLNNGLRLSNYDILAAQWSTIDQDLKEIASALRRANSNDSPQALTPELAEELTAIANSRLLASVNSDSEYEFEIDDADATRISLYEYLYSLSKKVHRTYFKTFGSIAKAETELLFPVSSLLFGTSISKLNELPRFFPKGDHQYDVGWFLGAVLSAAQEIDAVLAPLIGWDFARTISPADPAATRIIPSGFGLNQAALYMASFIAMRYDIALGEPCRMTPRAGGTQQRVNAFKRSLKAWYLYDSLNPFEGNDAYERLSRRMWNIGANNARTPNEIMLNRPDVEALGADFWRHIEDSLDVSKTPERKRLRAVEEVAIMRFVYFNDPNVSACDRDHVIPIAKCERLLRAPANHIANFMPLEARLNRVRGERLWADCLDSNDFDGERERIRRDLLIPPSEVNDNVVQDTESFKDFLRLRARAMAGRIVNSLDLEGSEIERARVAFRLDEP